MGQPFDLLLGRKTYAIFASYWPQQGDDDPINQAKKYVVSHGTVNTDWQETIQIKGDTAAEIRQLKQQDGLMLQVHGSSQLIQALLAGSSVTPGGVVVASHARDGPGQDRGFLAPVRVQARSQPPAQG